MTAPSHTLVQAEPDLSARTFGRLALSYLACPHNVAGACLELCSVLRPLSESCRDSFMCKHCPMGMEGLTLMVALKGSWQEVLMKTKAARCACSACHARKDLFPNMSQLLAGHREGGVLTLMVALEGSWQEFLTKTKAEPPDAHALPLSKNCPAVRFSAVSRASCGPVDEQNLLQDGNITTDRRPAPLNMLLYNEAAFAISDAVDSRPCFSSVWCEDASWQALC